MSSVEDRYYKLNRIVLKTIGVWPGYRTKWTPLKVLSMTSLFFSFVFVQFTVFLTHEVTMDLTVTILSFALPSAFVLFVYCSVYLKSNDLWKIRQHMYRDWESLSDTMEVAIMVDHASLAKLFTHMFLGFTICVGIITIMIYAIPLTLDIVAPINGTKRGEKLHIKTEYFLDFSKYYFVMVVHLTFCICLGAITVITISAMLLSYGFHACALFKVANYRMGIVMDKTSSLEQDYMIYKRIVHAVTFHRTAMQFCHLVIIHLSKPMGIAIVTGIASSSISLFRLLNTIMYHMDDFVQILIPVILVIIQYSLFFLGNHLGQQVTDNNSGIFDTVYNLPWYTASPYTKQLLLLILQRGNKKFYLSLSSLFNASYEGFSTLTTTSISYFTLLYSMLQ